MESNVKRLFYGIAVRTKAYWDKLQQQIGKWGDKLMDINVHKSV